MGRRLMATGLLVCMGIAALLTGGQMAPQAQAATFVEAVPTQAPASDELIRIHVIANSDSVEDQALKLQVRDAVLAALAPKLEGAADVAAAQGIIAASLGELEQIAATTIAAEGFGYGVRAEFGQFSFPGKSYGDLYLPAGEYQALRVVVGEGKGANFWCLIYPSFCYNLREVRPKPSSPGPGSSGCGCVNR